MGTDLTSLLDEKSITHQELGSLSPLTQTIYHSIENIQIPIYHIVPTWDHLIVPTSSAKYPSTPKNNIFYYEGYYNHIVITYDNEIAKAISKWIPDL
jgi:hypothetical protein